MSAPTVRGIVYRCRVCGAEVTVIAPRAGSFCPRCCNADMTPLARRCASYVCPVCGATVMVLKEGGARFEPRCCNRHMVKEAA